VFLFPHLFFPFFPVFFFLPPTKYFLFLIRRILEVCFLSCSLAFLRSFCLLDFFCIHWLRVLNRPQTRPPAPFSSLASCYSGKPTEGLRGLAFWFILFLPEARIRSDFCMAGARYLPMPKKRIAFFFFVWVSILFRREPRNTMPTNVLLLELFLLAFARPFSTPSRSRAGMPVDFLGGFQ